MTDFESFITGCSRGLLRTANVIARDSGEAEDLVQECFMRVARNWPRIQNMANPEAYARRILVNLALRESPSRQRRVSELQPDDVWMQVPAPSEAPVDDRLVMLAAFSRLTVEHRAVLTLRYLHDLSLREAADILACSTGTVKSRTSRALAELRRIFDTETTAASLH